MSDSCSGNQVEIFNDNVDRQSKRHDGEKAVEEIGHL